MRNNFMENNEPRYNSEVFRFLKRELYELTSGVIIL